MSTGKGGVLLVKKVTLKLVNDEKKKARILSAKACVTDNADCGNGATDICLTLDIAGCYGNSSYDYCKYIDAAACMYGSYDYCDTDWSACHNHGNDICATDN